MSESNFFNLPPLGEIGATGGENGELSVPLLTVICKGCKATVGDSTSFISAIRELGMITMSSMTNVSIDDDLVRIEHTGAVDEDCNFQTIRCGCETELGRMYRSTSNPTMDSIRHRFTVFVSALKFYKIGSMETPIDPAASQEILQLLHPSPDHLAATMGRIMSIAIALKEEQEAMKREIRKLGEHCEVFIQLPEDEDEMLDESEETNNGDGTAGQASTTDWRGRITALEEQVQSLHESLTQLNQHYLQRTEKEISALNNKPLQDLPPKSPSNTQNNQPHQDSSKNPKRKRFDPTTPQPANPDELPVRSRETPTHKSQPQLQQVPEIRPPPDTILVRSKYEVADSFGGDEDDDAEDQLQAEEDGSDYEVTKRSRSRSRNHRSQSQHDVLKSPYNAQVTEHGDVNDSISSESDQDSPPEASDGQSDYSERATIKNKRRRTTSIELTRKSKGAITAAKSKHASDISRDNSIEITEVQDASKATSKKENKRVTRLSYDRKIAMSTGRTDLKNGVTAAREKRTRRLTTHH